METIATPAAQAVFTPEEYVNYPYKQFMRKFSSLRIIVKFRINRTLCVRSVGMQVAFGRVRRKTEPTGGCEVSLYF